MQESGLSEGVGLERISRRAKGGLLWLNIALNFKRVRRYFPSSVVSQGDIKHSCTCQKANKLKYSCSVRDFSQRFSHASSS